MLSGGMPVGSVRITSSPSQDGSTVNDEVSSSDESSAQGSQNNQHKEGLMQRCSGGVATFALL
jgi:hypothetical protein